MHRIRVGDISSIRNELILNSDDILLLSDKLNSRPFKRSYSKDGSIRNLGSAASHHYIESPVISDIPLRFKCLKIIGKVSRRNDWENEEEIIGTGQVGMNRLERFDQYMKRSTFWWASIMVGKEIWKMQSSYSRKLSLAPA